MLHKTHKTRFPFLNNTASILEWREGKRILDLGGSRSDARGEMFDAFGCHGEPIADEIAAALRKLEDIYPEHTREANTARIIVTEALTRIGQAMADVRSELDTRLEQFVEAQRQSAIEEVCVSGSDVCANDYGVDLNTTLEQAFELGVDAASHYISDCVAVGVSVTLDDL